MNTAKRALTGLVAAAALLLGGIVAATPASAGGPTGSPYDGTDPATTGCSANAITVFAKNMRNPTTQAITGQMEVRYSLTCQTNWIRVNNLVPGAATSMYLFRIPTYEPGSPLERAAWGDLTENYYGPVWSNQVFTGPTGCVYVRAEQRVNGRMVGSTGLSLTGVQDMYGNQVDVVC